MPEGFLSNKKFKEIIENHKQHEKEKIENERERLAGLSGKVSFKIDELPMPLPADYATFQRLLALQAKNKGVKSSKGGNGMGVGSRIPLTEKEKWDIKVQRWNQNSQKQLDPQKDPQPGPMAYSLVAQWAAKKSKKESQAEQLPNIFKSVSKGPVISPYYAHI